MDIQQLVPVDYSNQRVLLTAQVAEVFNTTTDVIKENFRRSKEQFKEGVHYFKVTGEALRRLKSEVKKFDPASALLTSKVVINDPAHTPLIGKFASCLYLWTEQGAMLHCKMVNTNEAWKMLKDLIAFYFVHRDNQPPVEESLFQDEEPVKAKKKRRPLPEFAVVYSALLDNVLVKIGLTCDFNRRIKEVRKETGQDVEEVFTTGNLPLDDARKLEATVKAKFHDKNKGGELYDVPFEQVKAAIDKHDDKFDKLIALANLLPDSDEKTRLVLQAASLI